MINNLTSLLLNFLLFFFCLKLLIRTFDLKFDLFPFILLILFCILFTFVNFDFRLIFIKEIVTFFLLFVQRSYFFLFVLHLFRFLLRVSMCITLFWMNTFLIHNSIVLMYNRIVLLDNRIVLLDNNIVVIFTCILLLVSMILLNFNTLM